MILYLHFNDLNLAKVSSPEFKDRYEEKIDPKFFDQLDVKEIKKITLQYQNNI